MAGAVLATVLVDGDHALTEGLYLASDSYGYADLCFAQVLLAAGMSWRRLYKASGVIAGVPGGLVGALDIVVKDRSVLAAGLDIPGIVDEDFLAARTGVVKGRDFLVTGVNIVSIVVEVGCLTRCPRRCGRLLAAGVGISFEDRCPGRWVGYLTAGGEDVGVARSLVIAAN